VDGQRAPALRFGDPRVMALTGALALANVVTGFTNRSLRGQVSALLGVPYSQAQASYDLRRLRLKGLIVRLEHSNTYVLTPDGQRVAIFYTKVHNRLLRTLLAADRPPAPMPVRQALRPSNAVSATTSTRPAWPRENLPQTSRPSQPRVARA